MKKLLTKFAMLIALLGFGSALVLTSCEKDDPEDFLGSVKIQLELKEGLGDISLADINISLFNVQDNVEKKMLTNESGEATFTMLPAGTYNLNIAEPREDGEYVLTGSKTGIVVRSQEETVVSVEIDASITNAGLVIKEIYYVGANDGYATLFKDQFIEIFNNSSETIYADGLYVGHLFPEKSMPLPYGEMGIFDIDNKVYLEWVYQIPGSGKEWPIEPSGSLMIALNAVDFAAGTGNPNSIDNSVADLEIYIVDWIEERGEVGHPWDLDNPDVPNVIPIFLVPPMNTLLIDLTDPGIVLFERDTPLGAGDVETIQYTNTSNSDVEYDIMVIDADLVIDGVELQRDADRDRYKRMPKKIDASYTYLDADGGAFYNGLSARRKIDEVATGRMGRIILQDFNNSALDFESIPKADPKGYNIVPQ